VNEDQAAAHRLLDYLITKAAVSAKTSSKTVRIPYSELLKTIGQTSNKDVDLVVTISLEWDEKE
jgi:hypothetical protein